MNQKVQVRAFLAAGVCSCSQTGFLERIQKAIQKFENEIEYSVYSAADERAKEYGIRYRGVVVGNRSIGSNPTIDEIESAIQMALEQNS
ncbi:MAG: hypothetical protein ACFFED_12035 [Candidatus Thorarchaeota archaeon]